MRRVDPRTWDLHDTLVALLLLAVTVAPVAALGHAVLQGWAPHGDDATIALRSHDVLSGHPPLTGMRSTSGDSGHPDLASHHLGPLELYLLALPVALTGGHPVGLALGTALISVSASVLTVVWARRLGGELAMVVVGGGLLLAQWAIGLEAMYRPFNPYPALLAVFLLLVLCWAVLRRDHRALPPFAVAGALVLQANLAFVPLVLALLALVALATMRRERGRRRPDRAARRSYRWAAGLGLLAWLPSIVELLVHQPNNLTQITRWALSGTGNPIGLTAALQHLSLLAPVPGGFRPLSDELLMTGGSVAPWVGGAVLLLLAVISTGWRVPQGRASSALPARVALVANLAMLATASRLPEWPSAPYWVVHWLPVVAFSWAALVWRGCAYLRELGPTLPSRWVMPAGGAVLALALVGAVATARPDVAEDQAYTGVAREAVAALGDGAGRPVRIRGLGFVPTLAVAPAVAYESRRHGWEPHYLTSWPYPEDAEHLWEGTAGDGAVQLVVVDSAEPELAAELPAGAAPVATVRMTHREGTVTIYRVPGG